ncbi:AAA domain-containing protein [Segetibacter aerophilus]|uniref:Helicase n=1 Tax=Segetibacter aerophilus TaxID=670293 RepID=A0A512B815_9BACT|nr:AAA domain-containing protein [Segetibacter aerophilus]GEO08106.1 helicase [Segetibacter aerophilus]
MDYFKSLSALLQIEKEEDRRSYKELTEKMPVAERRANGMTWYPVAIKDTEIGRGDYLTVEVERTTHQDIIHQLRFGMSAALFSNHDAKNDRVEGTITYISANKLKISLRTDELPEWSRNGKLGIDAVFDQNSYDEMEYALKIAPVVAERKDEGNLIKILTGEKKPTSQTLSAPFVSTKLNATQNAAVIKILEANELAIVHGPPGTGKTTTLVQAIKALIDQDNKQVLVVAPSNAAVDLLSEKLSDEGMNVVRVGNPARVNERMMSLTLDNKMSAHTSIKEIKRLKKQAREFRDMAHKYKRSFGYAEREQRKALFNEVRNINKEVERLEQYMIDDVISKAEVITATMVGANYYTVRQLRYQTVVIDEAGQALEPACWIPILKAQKVVMAGDHCQLPPTIKSDEAARKGLNITLMEKSVDLHPEAVVLLEAQYRMHETIMGFSSREFYGDRLKAHPSVANHVLFPGNQPLAFIDTAGCGFEEKLQGTSISNPEEASFLLKHLNSLVGQLKTIYNEIDFPSIGVISPYKHQVEVLKELLLSSTKLLQIGSALTVNTIDSFQGQERDIIYISMTRSNSESVIGFLSDIRRMNVAMTRARKKLVVVGDSATLSQLDFYTDFITYAQEKNCYQSAWEFMD